MASTVVLNCAAMVVKVSPLLIVYVAMICDAFDLGDGFNWEGINGRHREVYL